MEILRLTAAPRLAVINRTGADDHVRDWQRRLGQHFNSVREFNAHHARFADRLELLESLAGIEQSWKPKLMRAVTIFRDEREQRLTECAEIIVELLVDALTHRETVAAPELPSRRAAAGEELKATFTRAVSTREARAHREIIDLFRHRLVKAETSSEPLFEEGLFSDETWRAFGLSERQLLTASAIAGAAAGAAVDVLTVGHTLIAGTAIGGAIGAAGGWLLGKQRPELKVALPRSAAWLPKHLRVGGSALVVGPYAALNFPWILLDRALATLCYVSNRAHARRDEVTLTSAAMKAAMEEAGISTARWDEETRKGCERIFAAIRRGKATREQRAELRELIRKQLPAVSAAPLPSSRQATDR
jgi:hypothetical protein